MADLKWKIDIQAPQGEVKKADAAVSKLEGHLHGTGAAANKAMGPLQRMARALLLQAEGFHTIGMAAHEAHAKTSEFLEFIGAEAALEVLKKIGEELYDIGKEAVVSAAKAERISRVIDIAAGGHAMGEASRKWIEEFSKTSEFSEEANEKAYIGLKKVGVDQQHTGLFMKAAADIAAVSDDKNQAYQDAISAFERVQQTGKVSSRMLRPLGIGVEDFKKLDRFKGMSSKAVNKALAGEANVNQGELFSLIMSRAGEKKIGTRSADNVDLLATKMEKLTELPERFFKKLGDTKAVGQLAHALGGALDKLDPDSPAGQKIFGALETAFTSVAGLVDEIDFDAIAKGIGSIVAGVEPAVEVFKEFGHYVMEALRALDKLNDAIHDFTPLGFIEDKIGAHLATKAGLNAPTPTDRMKGFDPEAAKAKLRAMGGPKAAMEGPEAPPAAELNSLSAASYGAAPAAEDKHRTRAGVVMGSTHHTKHTTVHVTVAPANVHVGGGDGAEEQGKKAANAYSKHLRKDLTSIVEQANASGGM